MEHRWGERCRLRFPVVLLSGRDRPINGCIRDLGAGGLYVEALTSPPRRHQVVHVVLRTPHSATRLRHWLAMVLRCRHDAAALMFDRWRFEELRRLLDDLHEDHGVAVHPSRVSPPQPAALDLQERLRRRAGGR
jgi:hypothetical protein